ncbi:MFS transporter [Parasphingorhabdus sp.]|uniref:MFS transporter n=1 Tax=Parasphingorhabdus sp. TaxID=2709688 RepID=UPI002B26E051|nr:MFS transporter [Parasphingorhabdus sp.]
MDNPEFTSQNEESGAPVDATQCADANSDDFVLANLKRNYTAHFLDGMLSFTGFRLIATPTFIPAYLFLMTGSETLVGVGSSLLQIGVMLSPILVAATLEHRRYVLPTAVRIGWFMRFMILALALAGWFLNGFAAIVATFAVLFLLGIGTGGQRVSFHLLLSKVIPIRRRGRLQGWRNFCGGLIAAALSYFAGAWLIDSNFMGNGYASMFLVTFILSSLGLIGISLIMREPEQAVDHKPPVPTARIARFSRYLADRNFRGFLIAQATCTMARAAAPFYILFAGQTLGLDGKTIGSLALCLMAADTLANLLWGRIGDRTGYRLTFMLAVLCWITSTMVLIYALDAIWFYVAFAGIGASLSGFIMSQQTMVLEFGTRADVAMRLGLTNTLDGVFAAIGPVLGGLLASHYGFTPLFAVSIALLFATLISLFRIRDPRSVQEGD